MTEYSATVSADLSGYTNSVQQAIALTKEYAAANEGLIGVTGRLGTKAIVGVNEALGVQSKLMKANVAEAANYQQVLGKVSASAIASGRSVADAQKATQQIARQVTGGIGSASELVSAVQKMGMGQDLRGIKEMSRTITELSAATGESGSHIATNLKAMNSAFDFAPSMKSVRDLGDSLTVTTSKFGASAATVADFSKNIAPFAKQVGMAQTSVIGLSTAFSRMGEDNYRSANVLSKMLQDIDLAAREGAPTLEVYAKTLGKTREQALSLAKASPTEFFVQFVEALDKQGPQAVRTLEQLGMEGVRTQKTLSALMGSGDLREMVSTANRSYGSGQTSEAAKEQLDGLNESAGRLNESLKQVAVASGEPLIKTLEKITNVSAKTADGLASLVQSDGMQMLMTVLGVGGGTLFAGAKIMGGIGSAASLASMGAQANQAIRSPGMAERMAPMMGWVSQNRRAMAGVGAAGMVAGTMMGNQTMGTLGTAAMMGAALLPGSGFGKALTVANNLGRDAVTTWTQPFTSWGKASYNREWRLSQDFDTETGAFRQGRGARADYVDVRNDLTNWMKKEGFDDEEVKKAKRVFSRVDDKGSYIASATVYDAAARARAGTLDKGLLMRGVNALDDEIVPSSAKGRTRAMGRYLGGMGAQLLAGVPIQAGAALMNPVGAGIAATAVVAGAGAYQWKKSHELEQYAEGNEAPGAAAYESFGMLAPVFDGVRQSGEALAMTFTDMTTVLGDQAKAGGEIDLGRVWNAMEGQAAVEELRYQNFKVGNLSVGGSKTDEMAMQELVGNYGMDTEANLAMIASNLKAEGKTQDEVERTLTAYTQYVEKQLENPTMQSEWGSGGPNKEQLKAVRALEVQTSKTMSPDQQAKMFADMITDWASENTGVSQKDIDQVWEAIGMEGYKAPEARKPNVSTTTTGTTATGYGAGGPAPSAPSGQTKAEWEAENLGPRRTDLQHELDTVRANLSGIENSKIFRMATDEATIRARSEGIGNEVQGADRYRVGADTTKAERDAAVEFAETLRDATATLKEFDTAGKKAAGWALVEQAGRAGFDTAGTAEQLRAARAAAADNTIEAQVIEEGLSLNAIQRGRERMGMTGMGALEDRRKAANEIITQFEGNTSQFAKDQTAAAKDELQTVFTEEIKMMQDIVRARKDHDRQMTYAQEDFLESQLYAQEDYHDQVMQAEEQFYRSQRYARSDFNTAMKDMAADYRTSQERAERQYNTQRERSMEDHARTVRRRSEDMAKSMYDPFSRIALEQTWSGGSLVNNMRQQQEMFERQQSNLDELRKAGVDQSVISVLGLNDPSKAQQLDRLLKDINAGDASIIKDLNELAKAREEAAGSLFGKENDLGAARMEEDFTLSLERMAKDREVWLADSQADYEKARSRSTREFNKSQARAQEQFDASMKWMEKSHNKSLDRMDAAHAKSVRRAEENFTAAFETISSDWVELGDAATAALDLSSKEWSKVVVGGIEKMKSDVAAATKDGLFKVEITGGWEGDDVNDYTPGAGTKGNPNGPLNGAGSWSGAWRTYSSGKNKGKFHGGADFAAPTGTPIYATRSGTARVVDSGNRSYGKHVIISGDGYDYYYAHMSSFGVRHGAYVGEGDMIGRVGSTGNSTGPHVHFEVRPKGSGHTSAINPGNFLWQGGIVTSGTDFRAGEGYPEAVIPLNHRGIDVLAQALRAAFGDSTMGRTLGMGVGAPQTTVVYHITEDHRVQVNGPVEVVSTDPERVGRELERKARERALISPQRR